MSSMKLVKLEVVKAGFNEMRNDPALIGMMEELGERVINATGKPDEYELLVRSGGGRTRANIKVQTNGFPAMQRNLSGNELLKALGSVGAYNEV